MELEDIPSGGRVKMWFFGVIVAILPILHGVRVLIIGATTIIGRRGVRMELAGFDAWCVGVFFIGLGAALHFHYFWGLFQASQAVSQIGKLASASVMMIALAVVVVRVLIRVLS